MVERLDNTGGLLMRELTVEPITNQSFSAVLNENLFTFRLCNRGGTVLIDITKNNVVVVSGARVVAGAPIVQPFSLLLGENFVVTTQAGALVDYHQFGITQFLFYVRFDDVQQREIRIPVPLV